MVSEYHRVADRQLQTILDNLEVIGDKTTIKGFDVYCNNGVLTLNLGDSGTFVLNKQPPNKQIWLSSPISGPMRFDHAAGTWINKRDNKRLDEVLNAELRPILGADINVTKEE
ncbi:Mitochondrial chaperone Frataxin [Irineochytrium annulatum]|nr:Mitochondrial chaperone Frataxin [Irineochytrium annulatum]